LIKSKSGILSFANIQNDIILTRSAFGSVCQ